ncbi:uncharacterized protein BJ171DRAFT_595430 [Polychytrium aggregatum]|uniref:uncharacterized protein n=1 Tax=Polychytrium aggregatum TaxID=110093 RepID=UPI0022FE67D8|nr:uncharacterized protein BJ171DRAFT_595430 [Polychytrium aggregatum]KAI9209002.1 hypothetical protein BJ171DRAFT_595430 [Polychytrium aggregatum]
MEVAGRALSFWCYQVDQEMKLQETIHKSFKDKCQRLEQDMGTLVYNANQEIQGMVAKLEGLERELHSERRKSHGLCEQVGEKHRQFQRLQIAFDKLKTKAHSASLTAVEADVAPADFGCRRSFSFPPSPMPLPSARPADPLAGIGIKPGSYRDMLARPSRIYDETGSQSSARFTPERLF